MTDTLPKAPGLIFCRSKPKPSLLTSVYNKWYSEIHVPDVLASGAIAKAARYRCRDDGYPIPYLAVYDVPDLTRLQSREFAAIPMTSDLLPNPQRPCHAYVDLDTRFYAYVDEYVVGEVKDGESPEGHAHWWGVPHIYESGSFHFRPFNISIRHS